MKHSTVIMKTNRPTMSKRVVAVCSALLSEVPTSRVGWMAGANRGWWLAIGGCSGGKPPQVQKQ